MYERCGYWCIAESLRKKLEIFSLLLSDKVIHSTAIFQGEFKMANNTI